MGHIDQAGAPGKIGGLGTGEAVDAASPAVMSADERARYSQFDRERGVRLSRLVGVVFGGITALALLAVGLFALLRPDTQPAAVRAMLAALAVCIALYAAGIRLAAARRGLLAAAAINGSFLLSICAFQLVWEGAAGSESLLVGTFGAYTIVIGISGVQGNARYMFAVTALTNLLVGVVLLLVPSLLRPGAAPPQSYVTVLIVCAVDWTIALLIFGASSLYEQSLHELGDIRLAFERAQKLDALKDQFITSVNHELRTPAMAMQGYLELLQLRHRELSADRRAALIEKACRAGDDLIALLTSILDIQRIDPSTRDFTREAVPLREAVEAAAVLIDPREGSLVERELHLDIPDGLAVWAEPVRVRQILTNLLSNAVKYSAPGTPVEIAARVVREPRDEVGRRKGARPGARPGPPMVEMTVRDHGHGIPPEQIPLLFNRFVRLPRDLASNVIGNGLGLHLCRTLAEAMGGTIWVESAGIEGEGSVFHVRLPLAGGRVSQAPARAAAPAKAHEATAHELAQTRNG
jgi:signal transduction histidine kinase